MIRKKPRLLIVEDDEAASFAYERFLVNAGFEARKKAGYARAEETMRQQARNVRNAGFEARKKAGWAKADERAAAMGLTNKP